MEVRSYRSARSQLSSVKIGDFFFFLWSLITHPGWHIPVDKEDNIKLTASGIIICGYFGEQMLHLFQWFLKILQNPSNQLTLDFQEE